MRIAVIGGGVSGIATAWFLQHEHEVTLFERDPYLGGHARTVPVHVGDHTVYAETGPRFYFDISYPYFLALLRLLRIPLSWCDTRITFTPWRRPHTLVLPPRSPRSFVQLLRSPTMFRHVLSLSRLTNAADAVSRSSDWTLTLRAYLKANRYPESFGPELIYPFLAASWGAPLHEIPEFPIYSLLKGMRRSPEGKLGFYEIERGMTQYIETFAAELTRVDVRLGVGVRRLTYARGLGETAGLYLEDDHGGSQHFDQVVLATSSRDAATLLADVEPAADLCAVVRSFRHFDTDIVIHGDPSFMPKHRADWGHVNLCHEGDQAWMTDWSGWSRRLSVFRTWMPGHRALPEPLYHRRRFHHLIMGPHNAQLQRQIASLQGRAGVWVVGMYAVDVDNHESALLSAVPLAQALAPQSPNLLRLLAEVRAEGGHDLSILPRPLGARPPDSVAPDEPHFSDAVESARYGNANPGIVESSG